MPIKFAILLVIRAKRPLIEHAWLVAITPICPLNLINRIDRPNASVILAKANIGTCDDTHYRPAWFDSGGPGLLEGVRMETHLLQVKRSTYLLMQFFWISDEFEKYCNKSSPQIWMKRLSRGRWFLSHVQEVCVTNLSNLSRLFGWWAHDYKTVWNVPLGIKTYDIWRHRRESHQAVLL